MILRLIISTILIVNCLHPAFSQCQDPSACNFNALASCEYATGICEFCSGETNGTGVVINNDKNDNGICDDEEGCTFPQACNYNPGITIDDGSCLIVGAHCDDDDPNSIGDVVDQNCNCEGQYILKIEMSDKGGNGYSGTVIGIINSDDDIIGEFTLEDGSTGTEAITVPKGCYRIKSTDDATPQEITYRLTIGNGSDEDVYGIPGNVQAFGVGVVSGCTDSEAINYNEEAECETGECYFCVNPEDCEIDAGGQKKAARCRIIRVCGKGDYIMEDSPYSGTITTPFGCHYLYLLPKAGPDTYLLRVAPNASTMTLNYEDVKNTPVDACYTLDADNCTSQEFDWPPPKKAVLTMHDDCNLAWEGISYVVKDENYNVVTAGSLGSAELGNNESIGFDFFALDNGCFVLEFIAEDCFYPCQTFSLDYTDQGLIQGRVDGNPIFFSFDAPQCIFGCTNSDAINYDINADLPCLGDNSCCQFAPLNDICDNAKVLEEDITSFWDTELASTPQVVCDSHISNDVWFTYQPTCNSLNTLSGHSTSDFVVSIYEGDCPSLTDSPLYCAVNGGTLNSIDLKLSVNQKYFFQVSSNPTQSIAAQGSMRIETIGCLGCTDPSAPNYDSMADINDGSCIVIDCPGDFNGDNAVTVADLTGFLGAFGSYCDIPQ